MKILVIVDMQNDFIEGSLANAKGNSVTQNVINEIKKDYDLFLLTRDTHFDNYLETNEGKNLPIKHCIQNSDGWQINKDVINEVINSKKVYKIFDKNGFGSFDLVSYLDGLNEKIDSITVVGLCSDICVISTALLLRAKFYNTPMYYIEDAMFATSDENQKASINILEACQIHKKA